MNKFFCAFLMFLVACGSSGVTSGGWKWESPNKTTDEEVELVIAVTQRVLEEETKEHIPNSAWDQVETLTFTYFNTFCFGHFECYGQVNYKNKKMWVTLRNGCLAWTSFPHELLHVFAKATGGFNKSEHDPRLFKKASKNPKETVEYKVQKQLAKLMNCE